MTNSRLNWVVDGILAVSSFPFAEGDIVNYKMHDISVIINLTNNMSYKEKYTDQLLDIEVFQLPVVDFSVPTSEVLNDFMEIVDRSIDDGKKVVVHCIGGCGRTGTLVSIWLYRNLDFDSPRDAIRYLRDIRPCSVETKEQEEFIMKNA